MERVTPKEQRHQRKLELQRARRAANPEYHRAKHRKWAKENRAVMNEAQKRYRAAHLDEHRIRQANRRLVTGAGTLTVEEWQQILEAFQYRCAYCLTSSERLQIEHIDPLFNGGDHAKENVVPACRSCNSGKGSKTLLQFLMVA